MDGGKLCTTHAKTGELKATRLPSMLIRVVTATTEAESRAEHDLITDAGMVLLILW